MKDKILKLIDDYWKFDKDQQPMSSWHDKQDLLKALEELLQFQRSYYKRITKREFHRIITTPNLQDGWEVHLKYLWDRNEANAIFTITGIDI